MSDTLTKHVTSQSPKEQVQSPQAVWPVYALFTGNVISYIGDVLTLLALPWFVLQTTGSVVQAGITGFCSILPQVLSAFFGSALVDRLGYKRTSVIGDLLNGLTVMLVPLLYDTIGLAFWQLLLLVFIGGLLRSPADTARGSLVPDLAQLAGMRLERANAWNDGVRRVSSFFGAPLAGLLIVVIGTSNLLWLDAISFGCSALLIGVFVQELTPRRAKAEEGKLEQGYLAELGEGLHFLKGNAVILTVMLVCMITNLLDSANFAVVQPAYMMQTFHSPIPFGILVAAFGGMAFIGTVIYGTIGHRLPRRLTFGISFTLGGALRFWILLIPSFPVMLSWFIVAGLAIGPINSLLDTVIQEQTPATMRARVLGVLSAGCMAGMPLGALAAGFVVTWIGMNMTLIVMGAIYLLATLSILVNPALKNMEKVRTEA